MTIYLNGEYLPRERASISVDDRGFLFGDGVYEVIRAFQGRFFATDQHLQRLERSLEGVEIGGAPSAGVLREVAERLLAENGLTEGHAKVYIQITRGAAPRMHAFPEPPVSPTVYAAVSRLHPPAELRARGAAAITHPDLRWSRCDLKTVNLLPNAAAKQRAVEAGAFEAILVRDGIVTEGASSNVFGVLDGVIYTYPKSNYILAGITRDTVLTLAAERGLPAVEEPLLAADLHRLDEIFLTGTTTEVQPVVRLDGQPIGGGAPGRVALELQKALAKKLRAPDTVVQ